MLEEQTIEEKTCVLPAESRADRKIGRKKADPNAPTSSKGHCLVFGVLGDGPGVRVTGESHLEFNHHLLFNADPDVVDQREQVLFQYGADDEKRHYFDIVVTRKTGSRIAYTVKPERRVSARFLDEMREIAFWVRKKGFAADVRLLTERDIDATRLYNARIMAAVRTSDPEAEAIVCEEARGILGAVTVRNLTDRVDLGARGYRAILRLIRLGEFAVLADARITPEALVQWKGGRK